MELSITLIIVIITVLVSLGGFNNQKLIDDLIFYPPAITQRKQWYRFFTCGLIHADFVHLLFNMLALYSFGTMVENGYRYSNGIDNGFVQIFDGSRGKLFYLLLYVLALFFSLLPTFTKHKNDYGYKSLGASGAVSAVVFAGLLLEPRSGVGIFLIPVSIPGYIFGPLYLIISSVLAKKGAGNINHSAHIWGALFGLAYVIIACKLFSEYEVVQSFIDKVSMHIKGIF